MTDLPGAAPMLTVPSANGVSLALHDLGGSGPPLMICHATGFHGRTYVPLAVPLLAAFHVWALDFRAHGASTPPSDDGFAWNGFAGDVLACVDAIEARSVMAFGHSMGGAAVLLAEAARPGTIERAYVYEPIVVPERAFDGGPNPLSEVTRRRRELFASKEQAMMRYALKPPLNVLRADALAAYVVHGFEEIGTEGTGVRLACRAEDEARTYDMTVESQLQRVMSARMPVAVAVGRQLTESDAASFGPRVAESLPDARLLTYPHLGHFGPLQDPDYIGEEVLAFLTGD